MGTAVTHDPWVNRLIRYPGAAIMRLRAVRLRLLGVTIGKRCWIQRISVPRNPWDIVLGDGVALDNAVVLLASGPRRPAPRLIIGNRTYCNRFTMFDASVQIEVGSNCMIGPFCYITDHDHAHAAGKPVGEQPLIGQSVHLGNDVWIGAGVIILKGVTIGDGAVVGAGAVVTSDVPPGAKMVGIPARQIGQRNSQ